jgi:hypothetical protein
MVVPCTGAQLLVIHFVRLRKRVNGLIKIIPEYDAETLCNSLDCTVEDLSNCVEALTALRDLLDERRINRDWQVYTFLWSFLFYTLCGLSLIEAKTKAIEGVLNPATVALLHTASEAARDRHFEEVIETVKLHNKLKLFFWLLLQLMYTFLKNKQSSLDYRRDLQSVLNMHQAVKQRWEGCLPRRPACKRRHE